jgi:hypothetical protein
MPCACVRIRTSSISITIFRIPPAAYGEAQPTRCMQGKTPRSNRGVLFGRCKIKGSHAFLLLQVPEGRHNVAHRGSGGDAPVYRIKPRRGGTKLTKYKFGIVFHAVLSQQCAKFVLEARLAVVRFLVLDIPFRLIEVG